MGYSPTDRAASWVRAALVCLVAAFLGCRSRGDFRYSPSLDRYHPVATQIEYPDAQVGPREDVIQTLPPRSVRASAEPEYWHLTLEEAIRLALANSEAMRDIGARVIRSPAATSTVHDPAIAETDPRSGPEAALSAFDAQFSTQIFWGRNERIINNLLLAGLRREVFQDYANFNAEIVKQSVTGTRFALRNITSYELNNALLNLFPSYYETVIEGEFRQPLLQGAGIEFNRTAGPLAKPGVYNGVLIARINTDITLADFEAAVQNLVDDIEQTYWELYLAYRDLDARKTGRDAALEIWRSVQRKFQAGTADHEQEAQAREQFYFWQSAVINALSGLPSGGLSFEAGGGAPAVETFDGVASGGPSMGRGTGVYGVERRLRRLMGLPAGDGRIILPAEKPSTVPVVFDWEESLGESLWRRVELRKQKWTIKRRELELAAARNFHKMRLDLVGQYRWRGFGDDLISFEGRPFASALGDLFQGDKQEWQLGVQLSTPVGNRIGHTAVRNAEPMLARERALYDEQELQVSHELSDAFAELDRAFETSLANYNRRIAAHQQLNEVRKKYDAGSVPLEFVLDAQRRSVDADVAYYGALVDYNLAVSHVHLARGSLLEYHAVYLSEGPWSMAAHCSAQKQARRFRPKHLDYCFSTPPSLSLGTYSQAISPIETPDAEQHPGPIDTGPTSAPSGASAEPEHEQRRNQGFLETAGTDR